MKKFTAVMIIALFVVSSFSMTVTIFPKQVKGAEVNNEDILVSGSAMKEPAVPSSFIFSDLGNDYAWAQSAILELYSNSIISGVDETHFEPGRTITRAEFTKLIVGVFGFEEIDSSSFTDVAVDDWHREFVLKAATAGVVTGYPNGIFLPDNSITREEMSAIIVRAFHANEYSVPEAVLNFTDAAKVADWAQGYVASLAKMGLIQGKDGGVFDPEANLTRAEAATALYRAMTYLSENAVEVDKKIEYEANLPSISIQPPIMEEVGKNPNELEQEQCECNCGCEESGICECLDCTCPHTY